ncbi:N/A [soil metagenome]
MATIVVAEDDEDVHALLKILLSAEGHQVRMARDGVTALALARAGDVDIYVLDIAMPGELDGLAVTRAIRSDPELPRVPILLLSARTRESDVRRGLAAGADGYLVKPFDTDVMLERVQQLLRAR